MDLKNISLEKAFAGITPDIRVILLLVLLLLLLHAGRPLDELYLRMADTAMGCLLGMLRAHSTSGGTN